MWWMGHRRRLLAKVLRQATRTGALGLLALFAARDAPMARRDRALVDSALFPPTSTLLTFVYCARHAKAPFGLSWLNFKELTRDPLCLEEKQFGRWLRSQERKK